jgi:hypothetical protein
MEARRAGGGREALAKLWNVDPNAVDLAARTSDPFFHLAHDIEHSLPREEALGWDPVTAIATLKGLLQLTRSAHAQAQLDREPSMARRDTTLAVYLGGLCDAAGVEIRDPSGTLANPEASTVVDAVQAQTAPPETSVLPEGA